MTKEERLLKIRKFKIKDGQSIEDAIEESGGSPDLSEMLKINKQIYKENVKNS